MAEKIFSGIQPSGKIHIGNWLGAIKQWGELQKLYNCIFSIVDYHAITIDYNSKEMQKRILDAALDLVSCGINKSTIFVQSDRPEHTELAWILNTITPIGHLHRMTQFKEKSAKHKQNVNVGLFDYPVLQAADILIYKAEIVPVGEDQIQHVELASDIARRFNQKFGETFPIPKAKLLKSSRIMGLDGKGKMSKSNAPSTYVALTDSPDQIRKKIAQATTDKGNEKEISPSVLNLFTLFRAFGKEDLAEKYEQERKEGKIKYSEMKEMLADTIIEKLKPIAKNRKELELVPDKIWQTLKDGAEKLRPQAQQTIKEVKQKMGLLH